MAGQLGRYPPRDVGKITPLENTSFLFPEAYFQEFTALLRELNVDVAKLCAYCNIDSDAISMGSLRLSYIEFRRLLVEAKRISQEQAIGLLIGRRLARGTHGILTFAAISTRSLRQALEVAEEYLPLRTTLVTMKTSVRGDRFCVELRVTPKLSEVRETMLEAAILAVKGFCDQFTLGYTVEFGVCFDFQAPSYADLAAKILLTDVTYGQEWSGLWFRLDHAELTLRQQDAGAFDVAKRICQTELEKIRENETESTKLMRLFLDTTNDFPTLATAARLLRVTPRTLHRRLEANGTSYKRLLDEARHTIAIERLGAGTLSIKELSHFLGYADPANFRRAFKRWEGIAPSRVREMLRK